MKKKRRLYRKYQCRCCGNYTLDKPPEGNYEICPVCFWEDNTMAYDEPDEECFCNHVSFNQARKNYKAFGACELDVKNHVRKPNSREKKR